MADEATQVSEQDTTVEQTTADSQTVEQTTDTQPQAGDQGSQTDSGKADQTASTGDKSKVETQDPKPESKPVSRRSAAYRIQQLVEENKSLRQQQKPVEQEDLGDDSATDDKPDISALVAKEVERRLNPVMSEHSKAADDSELGELFSGDKASERSKYEGKIRSMWSLPQYKDVAAQDLYKIASFNDAVSAATSRAIEEYKKAEKEAKESSASGTSNSNRTGKDGKSITDLSDEEFAARNERIKTGLPV